MFVQHGIKQRVSLHKNVLWFIVWVFFSVFPPASNSEVL